MLPDEDKTDSFIFSTACLYIAIPNPTEVPASHRSLGDYVDTLIPTEAENNGLFSWSKSPPVKVDPKGPIGECAQQDVSLRIPKELGQR